MRFCSSVPNILSGCGTPIDWCADSSAPSDGCTDPTSMSALLYATWDSPTPPYSVPIFMPNAPSSFSPWTTSSGI